MTRTSVLVVDDDQSIRELMGSKLTHSGYQVTTVSSAGRAIEMFNKRMYDVAVVDESMPDRSSVETIHQLKSISPDTPVILLADHSTRLSTLEVIHDQLFSFHTKPLDFKLLDESIKRAAEKDWRRPGDANGRAPSGDTSQPSPTDFPPTSRHERQSGRGAAAADSPQPICFLGESEAIRQVRQQIREVAPTDMTVLIRGESGVGKGIVARLIQTHSNRGPASALITINCPAIPESLMESELFGHESGAFTGADNAKPGRLELASGGTVFLDEIGEIPPNMQVKLLQVIEQKEIYHLGGKKPIKVDVRFIAATNAPLEPMISKGLFRTDLFYRLNEFSILIPPLRERIEDVPILVEHFLRVYAERFGRHGIAFPSGFISRLMKYNWPGNVRELETVVRRFALSGNSASVESLFHSNVEDSMPTARGSLLHQNQVQTILAVLADTKWNQRRAAKILGISYSALRRRVDKYGLKN